MPEQDESTTPEKLDVVMLALDDLHPDPENPRNNTSAISVIAASIRNFGFLVPLVIDADHKIIAGHARYMAAHMLEMDKVPCVIADDLTPEQALGFSIAENRSSDFSFFDITKLMELADGLDEQYIAEFDLASLMEFDQQVDESLAAPEAPSKREGLDLAPFEKYQYVTVICRNTYDYTNLLQQLHLEDPQARYVGKYLKRGHSIGRIIEYASFVARIKEWAP